MYDLVVFTHSKGHKVVMMLSNYKNDVVHYLNN